MANNTTGFGFLSFGRIEGGSPTAGLTRVFINSTDSRPVFKGDLVQDSTGTTTIVGPTVAVSTDIDVGNTLIRGVFFGCQYYSDAIGRVVWNSYFPGSVSATAGSATTAYIIDDPEQLFIVRSTAVIASSYIGMNVGFLYNATGNTRTGESAETMGVTPTSTAAPGTFRLVDFYSNYAPPGADGTDNATAGQIMVVKPNAWARNSVTGKTS